MKGWGKAITFKFTCKQKRLVFLHKIFGLRIITKSIKTTKKANKKSKQRCLQIGHIKVGESI